jgi:hypothetical protein
MQGECCADTPAQDVMNRERRIGSGVVRVKLFPTSYYDYFDGPKHSSQVDRVMTVGNNPVKTEVALQSDGYLGPGALL